MSSEGRADNFADVCYEEIKKIQNSDWLEFARRKLNVPESEIDDIKTNYGNDIREQKFKMLQFWKSHRKNIDCNPSVALPKLVVDFQVSISQIESADGGREPRAQDTSSSPTPSIAQPRSEAEVLQRYRSKGKVLKYFGTYGSAEGQMNGPHGICSTASDDIVVADFHNHRIQIFGVDRVGGRVKGSFGGKGTAGSQFNGVADVCVTSRGWIVASDFGNHRIQIFDDHGKFVRAFGGHGSGNGRLISPLGVATDESGLIYVCDSGNKRVQVFTGEGKYVRQFRPGSLKYPQYLSVTSNGRVVATGQDKVEVFDLNGHHVLHVGSQFKKPRGIATDDHGNIIIDEYHNGRVQIFTGDGKFVSCFGSWGSELGRMKYPVGVCVLSDGGIAVCDCSNHRVQIF